MPINGVDNLRMAYLPKGTDPSRFKRRVGREISNGTPSYGSGIVLPNLKKESNDYQNNS
jgi:hypothetical protein